MLNRFLVQSNGDGFCVEDDLDGRPVTGCLPRFSAVTIANDLNAAAATSPKALAVALGAVEDEDADDLEDEVVG